MSDVAVRMRKQRRSWAHPGSHHDRMVRLGLVALPLGIGVLAAFLVAAPLLLGGDVSFVLDKNKVAMATERLRIDAADYRGADSKGQPFQLHAGQAIQKSSAEPIVQLQNLNAQIQLPDGPASVVAGRGKYDMDKEQVAAVGPVSFKTADGYTLNTHDSTLDLKTRQMQSVNPVTGNTPTGNFSANSMSVDLAGRVIRLDGNARLRMVPKRANRP